MMGNDKDDALAYFMMTPSAKSYWYKKFMESMKTAKNPRFIGVDWASGHGMLKGEVIKREDNVTYVRFRDADCG